MLPTVLRAGSLAGTDFVQAMENAKSKAIVAAAAVMIQMYHRAKLARAKVEAKRRAKQEAAEELAAGVAPVAD